MRKWNVVRTSSFLKRINKYRKHYELLRRIDKKVQRLAKNPKKIGKRLSGELHGLKSTRVSKSFRIIFEIDGKSKKVYLRALDHRDNVY